jgi:predicted RNA binding protein YcfA (HicA-like mRNA interferase family)
MAIDYRGLRSLTARELIAALQKDGFFFVRQTGSHQRYAHADGRRVTIAPHGSGGTFAVKTLKSIIEQQACWTHDDLVRVGIIKQ